MRKILCTIDPQLVHDDHKKALEAALREQYAKHLSASDRVSIIWCELPPEQGYTNYEQPCVSLVVIEARDGLDQAVREAMLLDCATVWSSITGINLERLMISVFDASVFAEYMAANQRRMSIVGRFRFASHMVRSLLRAKLARGLLVFHPNLGS